LRLLLEEKGTFAWFKGLRPLEGGGFLWSYEFDGEVARWFMEDAVGAYREERPLDPLRCEAVVVTRRNRRPELLALSALPYPLLAALP
jgi:Ser/Thr protein kinase RdoA (MazF antagonist)